MPTTEKTVPIRDLTNVELRELIGSTVTLTIYADAESSEPAATATGVLSLVSKVANGNLGIAFADALNDTVFGPNDVVTVTYDHWVA